LENGSKKNASDISGKVEKIKKCDKIKEIIMRITIKLL